MAKLTRMTQVEIFKVVEAAIESAEFYKEPIQRNGGIAWYRNKLITQVDKGELSVRVLTRMWCSFAPPQFHAAIYAEEEASVRKWGKRFPLRFTVDGFLRRSKELRKPLPGRKFGEPLPKTPAAPAPPAAAAVLQELPRPASQVVPVSTTFVRRVTVHPRIVARPRSVFDFFRRR